MQAVGIFRVFKESAGGVDSFWLARPSVATSGSSGDEGDAFIDFVMAASAPVELTHVEKGSPITVTTSGPLPHGSPVVVSGVVNLPEANGTWVLRKPDPQDDHTYELYEPSLAGSPVLAAPVEVVTSTVSRLSHAFKKIPEREGGSNVNTRLAALKPELIRWLDTERPLLQVYWSGSAEHSTVGEEDAPWRPGGGVAPLYEVAKQIKYLANSQLAPKLLFVLLLRNGAQMTLQRTILFGDASPPFEAQPTLEDLRRLTGPDDTVFSLTIPKNREHLAIELPSAADQAIVYLIKSLPSGSLVFDREETDIP